MSDDAKIVVDGDIGPLKQKLVEMQALMRTAGEKGGEALGKIGPAGENISKVMMSATGGVAAFTLALSSVALAKFVEGTVEARAELQDLSEQTGATVSGLSALQRISALSSTDMHSVASAIQIMSRNMVSADDDGTRFAGALRAIGLDAQTLKNMSPDAVMLEIAKALEKYSDGMGKTAAVQAIFGKSGAQLLPFLKDLADEGKLVGHVTAEQAEQADKLTKEYAKLKTQIALASQGFMGSMVPGLQEVIKFTNEAIKRDGVWLGVLQGIGAAVVSVFGVEINATKRAEQEVNTTFTRLAAAKANLAKAEAGGGYNTKTELGRTMQASEIKKYSDEVSRLTAQLQAAINERNKLIEKDAPAKKEEKSIDPTSFAGEQSAKKEEKSALPAIKAELEAMRASYSEQHQWQEMTKAEELAFWQMKRQQAGLSQKDITAIETEMSKIKVDFAKSEAKELVQIKKDADSERMQGAKTLAAYEQAQAETLKASQLLALNQERTATESSYADMAISREQYVALMRQYSAQELAIELEFITAKKNAQAGIPEYDPTAAEQEAQSRLQARQAYLQRQNQIDTVDQQEKRNIAKQFEESMSESSSQLLAQMLTRQITWRNGMIGIYTQLKNAFIQMLITEPLRQYIVALARMLMVKMGWLTTNSTAETAASAKTMATKAAEADVVVSANATEAASGAAASASSIPYVGWILAGVAFAAVLAMVLGSKSNIKSARGGYDIPKGLNPMVQAHEEEMVLPAGPSNVMRRLADLEAAGQLGGASGASGHTVNVYPRGKMSQAEARESARHIANALNDLKNDGWKPK